jgi:heat shock protein HslJ
MTAVATVGAAPPAVAAASSFPLGQELQVAAVDGENVTGRMPTFVVRGEGGTLTGSGSTACNRWSASIALTGPDGLMVGPVRTTRMACTPDVMRTERAFLAALQRVSRWRYEGPALLLEGEGTSLRLLPVR